MNSDSKSKAIFNGKGEHVVLIYKDYIIGDLT
ncbi:hypothetical protein SAMN06265349_10613 [Flavobacterium resistens]|uniref:Uncharacterized protein n=1 Tax=Flavobacterium resistens TaxID=443612 RepID=A0A521F0P1_9FLAO|nr:hypothetical protein SAMN06265349_10613 [Flavobacterium resistens]